VKRSPALYWRRLPDLATLAVTRQLIDARALKVAQILAICSGPIISLVWGETVTAGGGAAPESSFGLPVATRVLPYSLPTLWRGAMEQSTPKDFDKITVLEALATKAFPVGPNKSNQTTPPAGDADDQ
jgi:hypothetical protein